MEIQETVCMEDNHLHITCQGDKEAQLKCPTIGD